MEVIKINDSTILEFKKSQNKSAADRIRYKDGILSLIHEENKWIYTGSSWVCSINGQWFEKDKLWVNTKKLKTEPTIPEGVSLLVPVAKVVKSIAPYFRLKEKAQSIRDDLHNVYGNEISDKWYNTYLSTDCKNLWSIPIGTMCYFSLLPNEIIVVIFSHVSNMLILEHKEKQKERIKKDNCPPNYYLLPPLFDYKIINHMRLINKKCSDIIKLDSVECGNIGCKKKIPNSVNYFRKVCNKCYSQAKCINCGLTSKHQPFNGYACYQCFIMKYPQPGYWYSTEGLSVNLEDHVWDNFCNNDIRISKIDNESCKVKIFNNNGDTFHPYVLKEDILYMNPRLLPEDHEKVWQEYSSRTDVLKIDDEKCKASPLNDDYIIVKKEDIIKRHMPKSDTDYF